MHSMFPRSLREELVMSRFTVSSLRRAVLILGAPLLGASIVLAGDRVHSTNQQTIQPKPAPVAVAYTSSRTVTISLVLTTPPRPIEGTEPFEVGLRGPDGQ